MSAEVYVARIDVPIVSDAAERSEHPDGVGDWRCGLGWDRKRRSDDKRPGLSDGNWNEGNWLLDNWRRRRGRPLQRAQDRRTNLRALAKFHSSPRRPSLWLGTGGWAMPPEQPYPRRKLSRMG